MNALVDRIRKKVMQQRIISEKHQLAQSLLQQGLPVEQVAQATKLSVEKVERLQDADVMSKCSSDE